MILDFRCDVDEICALLVYYAGYSSNPSSWDFWPLKMGQIGCPETSGWVGWTNSHCMLRNIPEERRSHLLDLLTSNM